MNILKTTLIAAFALLSAGLFGDGGATMTVLTEKPVIDGRIDAKTEYKYATSITNFLRNDRNVYSLFRTRVWMGYDQENMYFAFEMEDNRLLHANNNSANFKAKLKGPSQKVWQDECMEIRLLPPWAKKAKGFSHFYLAFNPNGATLSAAPDGFDKKFELKCKVAASRGEGYWYAEAAIPFAALGMPQNFKVEGSVWNFNFTRFDSENGGSTWCNLPDGHHNKASNFGRLYFGDINSPALKIPDFTQSGIQDFTVFTEHRGERLLCSSWNESYSATERPKLHGIADISVISKGSSNFRIRSTRLTPAEDFIWNWNYTTRIKPRTIYRNPLVRLSKGASLELSNGKDVKFNNRNIKNSGNKAVIVPNHGVNTVSFVSDGNVKLVSQSSFPMAENLSRTFEKGTHTVNFMNAVTKLDIPGDDKMNLKLSDGQAYKLHWWSGDMYKYFAQNSIEKISLNLIMPEGLEVAAAATDERHPNGFPAYRMAPHSNIYKINKHPMEINGKKFNRYEIWTDKFKLIGNENPIYFPYRVECFILIKANRKITGDKSSFAYYTDVVSKKGQYTELPRPLAVNVRSKIKGVQTGKIALYYKSRGIRDNAFAENSFAFLKDIGVDRIFSLMCNKPISQKYNIGGIAFGQLETTAVEPDRIAMAEVYKAYPKSKANLFGGKYPNMVYLNRHDEPWPLIDKAVAELRKRNPLLKDFMWDYEYPAFSRYADTTPETMKIFAEIYKLPEIPTQAIVQQKYLKQWNDFRCKELGAFSARLKKVLNKHGFKLAFYGGMSNETTRSHYCYDPQYITADEFMTVNPVNVQENKHMHQIARRNNAKLNYASHLCTIDRSGTKRGALLRRSILTRNGGHLLWYELGLNAEDANEIAMLTLMINKYGHFFETDKATVILPKGNVIEMAEKNAAPANIAERMLNDGSYKTAAMTVFKKGREFVAVIINQTKNPVTFKVSFPEANGKVLEYISGRFITPEGPHTYKIPVDGSVLFHGKLK